MPYAIRCQWINEQLIKHVKIQKLRVKVEEIGNRTTAFVEIKIIAITNVKNKPGLQLIASPILYPLISSVRRLSDSHINLIQKEPA